MIDLHTHSLLSDGVLLPSELVRRYEEAGYSAVAITDHVDGSNMDFVIQAILKVCRELIPDVKIKIIPGIEITHTPLKPLHTIVREARKEGIKLIIVHGETIVEPVIPCTNRAALECDIDILAHPGLITLDEARLAAKRNIYLEITSRRGHSLTNGHVARVAKEAGAKLVLNSDSHSPEDILSKDRACKVILGAGIPPSDMAQVFKNSQDIIRAKCRK